MQIEYEAWDNKTLNTNNSFKNGWSNCKNPMLSPVVVTVDPDLVTMLYYNCDTIPMLTLQLVGEKQGKGGIRKYVPFTLCKDALLSTPLDTETKFYINKCVKVRKTSLGTYNDYKFYFVAHIECDDKIQHVVEGKTVFYLISSNKKRLSDDDEPASPTTTSSSCKRLKKDNNFITLQEQERFYQDKLQQQELMYQQKHELLQQQIKILQEQVEQHAQVQNLLLQSQFQQILTQPPVD